MLSTQYRRIAGQAGRMLRLRQNGADTQQTYRSAYVLGSQSLSKLRHGIPSAPPYAAGVLWRITLRRCAERLNL